MRPIVALSFVAALLTTLALIVAASVRASPAVVSDARAFGLLPTDEPVLVAIGLSTREANLVKPIDAEIVGLPAGVIPEFYAVPPAEGGGYRRHKRLQAGSSIPVPAAAMLEAAPVMMATHERYVPTDRFQAQPAGNARLRFVYRHVYRVTVSKWSRGPASLTNSLDVKGSVSMQTDWIGAGDTITITATPDPGWRFAHWGLFGADERTDERQSSRANPLVLTVTAPVHVVAGFLPR